MVGINQVLLMTRANKRVFAIGNGESRKTIDLSRLYEFGIIYGCNAIYRDFSPDALVVVDPKMKDEIWDTEYSLDNKAYFKDWSADSPQGAHQRNRLLKKGDWGFGATGAHQYLQLEGEKSLKRVVNSNDIIHKKFPDDAYRIGYSSGPASVLIACIEEEPEEVYLIGHDLYSITNKFNNVYKDTLNYEKSDTDLCPPDNWINQLEWCFKDFTSIQFYQVNRLKEVPQWKKVLNLEYLTLDEMWKRLNR